MQPASGGLARMTGTLVELGCAKDSFPLSGGSDLQIDNQDGMFVTLISATRGTCPSSGVVVSGSCSLITSPVLNVGFGTLTTCFVPVHVAER